MLYATYSNLYFYYIVCVSGVPAPVPLVDSVAE